MKTCYIFAAGDFTGSFTKSDNDLIIAADAGYRNAKALGVDLTTVDTVIISHGHYDHTGGLLAFVKLNPNAKIYIQDLNPERIKQSLTAVLPDFPEEQIFRPSVWNAFGMDKEGADYRACQTYGPIYG